MQHNHEDTIPVFFGPVRVSLMMGFMPYSILVESIPRSIMCCVDPHNLAGPRFTSPLHPLQAQLPCSQMAKIWRVSLLDAYSRDLLISRQGLRL